MPQLLSFSFSFHRKTFTRKKEKKEGERAGEDRRYRRNTLIEPLFLYQNLIFILFRATQYQRQQTPFVFAGKHGST